MTIVDGRFLQSPEIQFPSFVSDKMLESFDQKAAGNTMGGELD